MASVILLHFSKSFCLGFTYDFSQGNSRCKLSNNYEKMLRPKTQFATGE